MNKEDNGFLSFDEFDQLIDRYNQLREGKISNSYFDVIEFEGLLDYHIENSSIEDIKYLLQLADKQHPGATSLDIRRAKFFFSEGRFREAYSLLDKLEMLEPSNHEVYLIKGLIQIVDKRVKDAKVSFRKAIELADDDLEDIYYTIAVALESARQYKEAMRYFKKSYQASDEEDIDLLYDLAYCSEKAGYYDDSIRYYHQYLDVNPFSESAWYNLGVNFHSLEKFRKALEAFEYALTIDPEYIMAIQGMADSLYRLERYADAVSYYQKAMDLNEEDAEGLCEIGECYRMLSENEKAAGYFDRALKLDPNYADANFGIGIMKYDQGQILESIVHLKKAIKAAPYNPDYWYALGISCLDINFTEDAEEAFERAVKLYPYDPDIWVSYADLEYENGNVEKAIDLLNQGDAVNKKSARIKYRLAAYHLSMSNESAGLNYFTEALKLNKNESIDFFDFYPDAQYLDAINRILSDLK